MREVAGKTKVVSDREIIYSRTVKAGKRIYYLDVKQNKLGEPFISITESKRINNPDSDSFVFEKHKLFIYKEDFGKFQRAMEDIMSFIYESDDSLRDCDNKSDPEKEGRHVDDQLTGEDTGTEDKTNVSIRFDVEY